MDERVSFLVLSSQRTHFYRVEAYPTAKGVRFACECQGAQTGACCRHRLDLALGDLDGLDDPRAADLARLKTLLDESGISANAFVLATMQKELEALKKSIADQKKEIGRLMRG